MGAHYYYHNVTRGRYNESDVIEVMEQYEEGDVLLVTERGDATVTVVEGKELDELWRKYNEYLDGEEAENDNPFKCE